MNNLAQDREEVATDAERRWVQRVRRQYGIRPDEAATWAALTEQNGEDATVALGRSPGDVLWEAEHLIARGSGRRDGVGRWTLEVWGDGENTPLVLRIRPYLEEPV